MIKLPYYPINQPFCTVKSDIGPKQRWCDKVTVYHINTKSGNYKDKETWKKVCNAAKALKSLQL